MRDLIPLIPYLKKYKIKIIIGFLFVIVSIFLQSMYPLVIGNAIDELTYKKNAQSLIYYGLLSVGIILVGGIFLFMTRRTIIVASREIENDIRYDFFAHLQKLSKNFYNQKTTGDIMAHATNDINNVRNLLGPGIMYSMQTILRTVITLIILFSINVEITIISLIPLPFISYLVYSVMKRTYGRSMKVQEAFSNMTTRVQENFAGIRVIKSYVRENFEIEQFNKISADYQKKNLSLARMQAYSFPMMFLLTGLSIILVIYFGGMKVINGTFTVGNIAEFVVYLGQLTWPMIAFGWVISLVQRAAPSMKRITDIMNTKSEITNPVISESSIDFRNIMGKIEFKNVTFRYPNTDIDILKNINLNIPLGSTLGIIGYTGVGKSTFINLIPRIYDITEGEILIDDINIKNIPLNALRGFIGIVPQESFLFSDTITNNIAYTGEKDFDRIIDISKKAGLYKDVNLFPEKFQTILGERGITLSGGQKQRTAIARALYRDPKILILDDSLSAVDTNTEAEILNELKSVMQNRTSIIISHRISTLQNADNIIVLDEGKIKEKGTHNVLIGLEGIYYNIYLKQLLEEEIKEL
ncbi:MAG: ABC transporter ATP-binding protein [Ignavibacteriae bacterium]|nr:ABC transporter ATP-binding protein [Ignavibacteriota bacterium]